jgi:tripartite-type tricarboxylate transporter receptor subunit TctC
MAAALCGLVLAGPARAADDAGFFAGRQIQFLIGTGAGDSYDIYSRLLARHWPKHIAGAPVVTPVNRPGAGSLAAVNALYNASPRDGTVVAMGQRFVPLMPLLDMPGAQFEPMRLAYVGSMARDATVCVAHKRAGIKTVADAKGRQVVVGTMGAGTEITNFTAPISRLLGVDFKVVRGYNSSGDIDLAIERGELQGRCGVSWSSLKRAHPDWLANGTASVFLQIAMTRAPDLPETPAIAELVSERDRAALRLLLAPGDMARPVFGAPDMPPGRLETLRAGFDAATRDPELLGEAAKEQLDIDPMKGADIAAMIAELYAAPADIVARAKELVAAAP